MSLFARVQSILLKPKATWPVIAAESTDRAAIYTRYLLVLAAIPALASFVGLTLVGIDVFGVSVRVPIVTGIVRMVVGYLLSLLMVFVLALIVDALAPTFGGSRSPVAALKVVAYSMTAVFIAGILGLLPILAALGALIGLVYAIYLLYTGLPVLMRTPTDKAGAYTAVTMVCGLVCGVVVVAVLALVAGGGTMGLAGLAGATAATGASTVTIKTPDGAAVTINPSSMADMARRMAEAGKRIESAQGTGDGAAAGKAMGDVFGALAGGTGGTVPIAAADLKSMLPEALGDMKRQSFEASGGQAMGIAGSSAKASYGSGDRHVDLSITDTGGLAGLASLAGWAGMTMDKETDGKVEKVYKDGGRTVHEEYRKDGSGGEMTVILANGVIVEADGRHVDMAALKSVVAGVDFTRIEALKRAAKP